MADWKTVTVPLNGTESPPTPHSKKFIGIYLQQDHYKVPTHFTRSATRPSETSISNSLDPVHLTIFKMNIFELMFVLMAGKLQIIEWLMDKGLLKRAQRCPRRTCRGAMRLVQRENRLDGYQWRCSRGRCRSTKSVRDDSFFGHSNLSLGELTLIIYCWAIGMRMPTVATVLGISEHSVMERFSRLRDECSAKLVRMPHAEKVLGGPGQIVEIDESLLIKRKYNRGQVRDQHQQWVFGMYDRTKGVGWIRYVDRRDRDTLLPIVQEFIHGDSVIHSDAWGAYNGLAALGYQHEVVVHAHNFVDPVTGVHTNGVEAYWSRAKQKLKAVYGSRFQHVPSYLDEFMWRERFGMHSSNAFQHMLAHIGEHYNCT